MRREESKTRGKESLHDLKLTELRCILGGHELYRFSISLCQLPVRIVAAAAVINLQEAMTTLATLIG